MISVFECLAVSILTHIYLIIYNYYGCIFIFKTLFLQSASEAGNVRDALSGLTKNSISETGLKIQAGFFYLFIACFFFYRAWFSYFSDQPP